MMRNGYLVDDEQHSWSEHWELTALIKANERNRDILRDHAEEAIATSSAQARWLTVDREDGKLYEDIESFNGSFHYCGSDPVLAFVGSHERTQGEGSMSEYGIDTAEEYLKALLADDYDRIFSDIEEE